MYVKIIEKITYMLLFKVVYNISRFIISKGIFLYKFMFKEYFKLQFPSESIRVKQTILTNNRSLKCCIKI